MKKNIINKLSILASVITISSGANANEIKPYIGIGYQANNLDYKNVNISLDTGNTSVDSGSYFEDNLANFNLFAGFKVKDYLSFEIGYFKSKEENKSNNATALVWTDTLNPLTTNSESKLQIINFDIIYNHKLDYANKFNLLALTGLSKIDFDTHINYLDNGTIRLSESNYQSGYGFNLGLGLEANIYQNLSIRAVAKYISTSSIDYFDNLINYNLGVKYQF
ncbi:porin family protein [Rickettsiales bacterium]|nr:porin family protein [Rickettsiales bacterium]